MGQGAGTLPGSLTALVSVKLPTRDEDLVELVVLLMELLSVKPPTASREQAAARLPTELQSVNRQLKSQLEL